MQRKYIEKQQGVTQRHHFVHVLVLLLHQRQFAVAPDVHTRYGIVSARLIKVAHRLFVILADAEQAGDFEDGFATFAQAFGRFVFGLAILDGVGCVQQAAADLLGSKGGKASPLEAVVV